MTKLLWSDIESDVRDNESIYYVVAHQNIRGSKHSGTYKDGYFATTEDAITWVHRVIKPLARYGKYRKVWIETTGANHVTDVW